MGSGDKVKFWEDAWFSGSPLRNLYPRLFSLSLDQGLTVAEVGEWEDFVWLWRFRCMRVRLKRESTQEEELLRLLSSVKLLREVKDRQVWEGDASGEFSVKFAYDRLEQHVKGSHHDIFKAFSVG